MKVAFIQPSFPREMPLFVAGLASVGAEVVGVGEEPVDHVAAGVARHLSGWVQIPSYTDEDASVAVLLAELAALGVDRVESLWEPTVHLAARVREGLGLPGMSADTVAGFRDKQLMKERAAAAGARVPISRRLQGTEGLLQAAEDIGYPVVIKPIAGAGSASTWGCQDRAEVESHLDEWAGVGELSVEAFIQGEEHTYDALCIEGLPVLESVTRYYPPPLVSRNEEHVSPAQITYRNPYVAPLLPGIALGRRVVAGLGMGTGIVHMEWFQTSDGGAVMGEIACRPGGSKLMDQWNWSQDIDIYREWARAVCWGSCEAVPQHAHHVGVVFKRARGQGHIQAVLGADRLRAELGGALVEDALLPVGAQRRDWKQTLLSDGWMAVRDPSHDRCRAMMERIVDEVTLIAG